MWAHIPACTRWFMGGAINESMRCMSYFPVTIRGHTSKIFDFIAYTLSNASSFDEVFLESFSNHSSIHMISQFNVICTYLWHYKHDEYTWYLHSYSHHDVITCITCLLIYVDVYIYIYIYILIHTCIHTLLT